MDGNQVGDDITPLDPLLEPVEIRSFGRAAQAPEAASPAVDVLEANELVNNEGPILFDQRGASRTADGLVRSWRDRTLAMRPRRGPHPVEDVHFVFVHEVLDNRGRLLLNADERYAL